MTEERSFATRKHLPPSQVAQAAELHALCFPEELFTGLGRAFLRRLYAKCIDDPRVVVAVLEEPESGEVVAIALGSMNPSLYSQLALRFPHIVAWGVLRGLFCSRAVRQAVWHAFASIRALFRPRMTAALEKVETRPAGGPVATFILLCVHPDWRGKGHAQRLSVYYVDEVFRAGADRIMGAALASNPASLAIWRKLGWDIVETTPGTYVWWLDKDRYEELRQLWDE